MSEIVFSQLYGPIYGSFYFAVVLTTGFYGVSCMQTFFYYLHYPDDPWHLKCFVLFMWALNTVHEALNIAGAYKYFLAGWVNGPMSLFVGPPELVVVFITATAVLTQGFLVYRLYVFSGNKIILPLLWVGAGIVQLGSSLMYVIKGLKLSVEHVNYLTLYDDTFKTLSDVCFAVNAGVDILIAMSLTFLLFRERNTSRLAGTAGILQRLMVFAVNTGIWTAMFALLSIVLMEVFPDSMYYGIFAIPLCSVYCNTLLANLNARSYVRGGSAAYEVDTDLFKTTRSVLSTVVINSRHEEMEMEMRVSGRQGIGKTTELMSFPADSNFNLSTISEKV